MIIDERPRGLRYLTPFVTVGAASFLASLLPWRVDPSHFTLYFLAVMLSAWYGGWGAGIISTLLSAVALDYFFIAPIYSVELDVHAFVRLGVFLIVAIITSILTNARRQAEMELRLAQVELEDRVRQRTEELASANRTLREEIAERRKAEGELLRLQQQVGRVEGLAALGRMIGTVAHDLGTPLNSVLGYTQLLAQESLTERARRRLGIIEAQIHRMGDIIQSYLAFSREGPRRELVQINEIIRDTLTLLQPIFEKRQVKSITQLGTAVPAILCDANAVQRMLINLLDNAVDACAEDGQVRVHTCASNGSENRREGVTIELADTGAGIAPEILPKVFDLFMTTKPSGKGTGLGLVICQEIIKSHGGSIGIASELGRGTTVTVFLPSAGSPPAKAEERHESPHIDR